MNFLAILPSPQNLRAGQTRFERAESGSFSLENPILFHLEGADGTKSDFRAILGERPCMKRLNCIIAGKPEEKLAAQFALPFRVEVLSRVHAHGRAEICREG